MNVPRQYLYNRERGRSSEKTSCRSYENGDIYCLHPRDKHGKHTDRATGLDEDKQWGSGPVVIILTMNSPAITGASCWVRVPELNINENRTYPKI